MTIHESQVAKLRVLGYTEAEARFLCGDAFLVLHGETVPQLYAPR